ncbi:MAG: hypoxanthine phosphoribosyltransferase [Actinobacteria bacterium]|nr:hypoxanthine phosphoribosyltransferase [Actinomycetota bacterium]
MEVDKVLFSEEQIRERVGEIASQISADYKDIGCLMIGILKGAFVFLSDLARSISSPAEFDFMALSSYGSSTKTSGVVRILKDLDTDIHGRDVLIVEDIIDTGLTLKYLMGNLSTRGPSSLSICALLNKETTRQVQLPIKYVGFSIPDIFVVGYGLDYAERYRNLPYIASVKQ